MPTKLGPHILGNSSDAAAWVRAGAPLVKLVGDFGFAPEAAALPHRPLVIGRVVETYLDPNRLIANDPVAEARAYVANFLESHIRANLTVTHWEGPNECVVTEPAAMNWYAMFLNEFSRVIASMGKRAVIGGWAVGNPDYPLWSKYGPALQAVSQHGAILSRHSYAGPDRSTWGYLLLRHREDNRIFSGMGFPNLPLLITEAGADSVPFGNPPGKPWKDLYGEDAARYYGEILGPLDAELQADSYVLGATVFTNGAGWERHNIDGAVTRILIDHTQAGPPPPPPPSDGATHTVAATLLNTRLHPWSGRVEPPKVRLLALGTRVRVEAVYKAPSMAFGWGCISRDGNEWCSMGYLRPLA